jgi:hypothetical protein
MASEDISRREDILPGSGQSRERAIGRGNATGGLGDVPSLVKKRWSGCAWLLTMAVGLVVAYYGCVGFPRTPMTAARADRLFGTALSPGASQDEAIGWLASQGIPHGFRALDLHYSIQRRRDDGDARHWMDRRGHGTMAEWAGLDPKEVFSVIRIEYPDADRDLLGRTRITVYLVFDGDGRLIKHWVDEFYLGL